MEEREIPVPGSFYRHFKNKLYQVAAVAVHSETGESMVVYQALYGDYGYYVRPLPMFLSEVDRTKYPDADQRYRFEKLASPKEFYQTGGEEEKTGEGLKPTVQKANQNLVQTLTLKFLDAEGVRDKLDFLNENQSKLDRRTVEDIAVSLDLKPENQTTEEVIGLIRDYLEMMLKFEGRRPNRGRCQE